MQKAQLTSAQRSYCPVAGAVGHVLFSLGWFLLGVVALGGGITLLLGGTAQGVTGLFGDIPALKDFLSYAVGVTDTNVAGPVFLGPVVGIVGSLIVGALVWWWMTWSRRGSASNFAGVTATASATAVTPPRG
ncbi:hypothetical protein [Rhodoglobus aureus]|uniref:Uncharacterized protein n=1 Tax=Rhodoglobus aureus TaxID=191497 RepID=A0ABP4GBJ9_9MICO